jgi:uncharacterized membrane protein
LDPIFLANSFNKWLHLTSAGIVVGGLIYLLYVLMPTLNGLPEEQRKALWQTASRKAFRWIMWAIAVLLLTGIHNIMTAAKTLPGLGADKAATYWNVFGAKAVLFLVAFILVHSLYVRAPIFRQVQEKPRTWITAFMWVALVIVFLSGYLTLMRLSGLSVENAR